MKVKSLRQLEAYMSDGRKESDAFYEGYLYSALKHVVEHMSKEEIDRYYLNYLIDDEDENS